MILQAVAWDTCLLFSLLGPGVSTILPLSPKRIYFFQGVTQQHISPDLRLYPCSCDLGFARTGPRRTQP